MSRERLSGPQPAITVDRVSSSSGPKPRAVAVLVRDQRVLVIARHKRGVDYLVLPGGGIEPGETPAAAVVRELAEETGLVAREVRPLWVRDDGGRTAHYFGVDDPGGDPVLGGPEASRVGPDNRYAFRWLGAIDLAASDLRPAGVAPAVRSLLAG